MVHPLKHAVNSHISVMANFENLKINYLGARKNPQKSVNFILPIRYKCDRLVAESIIREE